MNKFFKYNFLSIAWALVILVLTLIPGKALPNVPIFGIDKVVHFGIFGLLLFLSHYGLKKQFLSQPASFKNAEMISFVICIFYGALIEVVQNYIPGRSFSEFDIIANTIGVILGYYSFRVFEKYRG